MEKIVFWRLMMNKKTILITGVAGFIGANLGKIFCPGEERAGRPGHTSDGDGRGGRPDH